MSHRNETKIQIVVIPFPNRTCSWISGYQSNQLEAIQFNGQATAPNNLGFSLSSTFEKMYRFAIAKKKRYSYIL